MQAQAALQIKASNLPHLGHSGPQDHGANVLDGSLHDRPPSDNNRQNVICTRGSELGGLLRNPSQGGATLSSLTSRVRTQQQDGCITDGPSVSLTAAARGDRLPGRKQHLFPGCDVPIFSRVRPLCGTQHSSWSALSLQSRSAGEQSGGQRRDGRQPELHFSTPTLLGANGASSWSADSELTVDRFESYRRAIVPLVHPSRPDARAPAFERRPAGQTESPALRSVHSDIVNNYDNRAPRDCHSLSPTPLHRELPPRPQLRVDEPPTCAPARTMSPRGPQHQQICGTSDVVLRPPARQSALPAQRCSAHHTEESSRFRPDCSNTPRAASLAAPVEKSPAQACIRLVKDPEQSADMPQCPESCKCAMRVPEMLPYTQPCPLLRICAARESHETSPRTSSRDIAAQQCTCAVPQPQVQAETPPRTQSCACIVHENQLPDPISLCSPPRACVVHETQLPAGISPRQEPGASAARGPQFVTETLPHTQSRTCAASNTRLLAETPPRTHSCTCASRKAEPYASSSMSPQSRTCAVHKTKESAPSSPRAVACTCDLRRALPPIHISPRPKPCPHSAWEPELRAKVHPPASTSPRPQQDTYAVWQYQLPIEILVRPQPCPFAGRSVQVRTDFAPHAQPCFDVPKESQMNTSPHPVVPPPLPVHSCAKGASARTPTCDNLMPQQQDTTPMRAANRSTPSTPPQPMLRPPHRSTPRACERPSPRREDTSLLDDTWLCEDKSDTLRRCDVEVESVPGGGPAPGPRDALAFSRDDARSPLPTSAPAFVAARRHRQGSAQQVRDTPSVAPAFLSAPSKGILCNPETELPQDQAEHRMPPSEGAIAPTHTNMRRPHCSTSSVEESPLSSPAHPIELGDTPKPRTSGPNDMGPYAVNVDNARPTMQGDASPVLRGVHKHIYRWKEFQASATTHPDALPGPKQSRRAFDGSPRLGQPCTDMQPHSYVLYGSSAPLCPDMNPARQAGQQEGVLRTIAVALTPPAATVADTTQSDARCMLQVGTPLTKPPRPLPLPRAGDEAPRDPVAAHDPPTCPAFVRACPAFARELPCMALTSVDRSPPRASPSLPTRELQTGTTRKPPAMSPQSYPASSVQSPASCHATRETPKTPPMYFAHGAPSSDPRIVLPPKVPPMRIVLNPPARPAQATPPAQLRSPEAAHVPTLDFAHFASHSECGPCTPLCDVPPSPQLLPRTRQFLQEADRSIERQRRNSAVNGASAPEASPVEPCPQYRFRRSHERQRCTGRDAGQECKEEHEPECA